MRTIQEKLASDILETIQTKSSFAPIEKDLLLEKIRKLYVLVLNEEPVPEVLEKETTPLQEMVAATVEVASPTPDINLEEKETDGEIKQLASPMVETEKSSEKAVASKNSLNDTFSQSSVSVNEKLMRESATLNQKLGTKKLKNSIDLNRQFVFTQELFAGDGKAYSMALSKLEEADTLAVAKALLEQYAGKYQWQQGAQAVKLLERLVVQKFSE